MNATASHTGTLGGAAPHIRSLDGVRGLAILMVVVFHARLANYGWLGVQLFFVLSGFLITGILWKERATAGSLGFKFKKFWTRRALRIFPLYFGYLLALGVVYVIFHFPPYYLKFIPYLLTYTFNYTRTLPLWQDNPLFTQLWSLCVEEQFYIVFPFIIFLCPARFVKAFMLSVIVLAPVIRFLLTRHYLSEGVSALTAGDATCRNTLSHMDAFFWGALFRYSGWESACVGRRFGFWGLFLWPWPRAWPTSWRAPVSFLTSLNSATPSSPSGTPSKCGAILAPTLCSPPSSSW
jgi:peptidoglycan/LPS O-acetylase OafA/YrhL